MGPDPLLQSSPSLLLSLWQLFSPVSNLRLVLPSSFAPSSPSPPLSPGSGQLVAFSSLFGAAFYFLPLILQKCYLSAPLLTINKPLPAAFQTLSSSEPASHSLSCQTPLSFWFSNFTAFCSLSSLLSFAPLLVNQPIQHLTWPSAFLFGCCSPSLFCSHSRHSPLLLIRKVWVYWRKEGRWAGAGVTEGKESENNKTVMLS